jgi:folate-dependent tRNA-U54 methylase TrmFO/GidA
VAGFENVNLNSRQILEQLQRNLSEVGGDTRHHKKSIKAIEAKVDNMLAEAMASVALTTSVGGANNTAGILRAELRKIQAIINR